MLFKFDDNKLKLLTDNFCYHSSKIYQLSFSLDDTMLISSSLDRNCILWNVEKKSKVKVYECLDHEVVLTCGFVDNKGFIAGGHNCTLTYIQI